MINKKELDNVISLAAFRFEKYRKTGIINSLDLKNKEYNKEFQKIQNLKETKENGHIY